MSEYRDIVIEKGFRSSLEVVAFTSDSGWTKPVPYSV